MANTEVSGIKFDLSANTDKATSGLRTLSSALDKISSKSGNLSKVANAIKEIAASADKANGDSISSIASALDKASSAAAGTDKRLSDISSSADKAGSSSSQVDKLSSALEKADSAAQSTNDHLKSLGEGTLNNVSSGAKSAADNTTLTGLKTSATGVIDNTPITNTTRSVNGLQSALNRISGKDVFSFLTSSAKEMRNTFSSLFSMMRTGASYLSSFSSAIGNKMFGNIKNAVSGLNDLKNAIGRIVIYRAIRSLIKEITSGIADGIQNAYYWSVATGNQFATSMDAISASALYVKNSLGAMAAPLINVLAPAIDYVTEKFVELINTINQVFALLSGSSTWIKAVKVPYSYAQAIGDTGDEADKAKKKIQLYLASFDELHVIPEPSTNKNSSSGSDTPKYNGDFEQVENISNTIKDAFNKTDWTELGTEFGKKLNGIVDTLDDWVVNKFRPAVMKWSTRIATFLNGAIESIDFVHVGKLFGDGLNALIDGANNFMNIFNYYNFGSKIGDAVIGWFDTVNWENIGLYFSNKLNSLISAVQGFVDNLNNHAGSIGNDIGTAIASFFNNINWDTIRATISSGLSTVANLIEGFATGEDGSFANFSEELSETVREVLADPDMDRIISGISAFVGAIADAIGQVPWYDVGYKIGYALGSLPWDKILKTVAISLINGLIGAIRGVLDSDNGGSLIIAVGIFAMFKVGLSLVVAQIPALLTGGGGLLGALGTGISSVLSSLASSIPAGILSFLSNPVTAAVAVISGLVIAEVNGIPILSSLSNIAGKIVGWLAALVPNLIVKIINGLGDMFNAIKNYFSEHIQEAEDNGGNIANGILNGIVDAFKNIGQWIHDHIFQPFIDGFRSAFQIHSPSQVMYDNGSLVSQGLLNGIGSVDLLEPIRNFVSEISYRIPRTMHGRGGAILLIT